MPALNKKKKPIEIDAVYPVVEVRMFHCSDKVMTDWSRSKSEGNPLTGEVAKELLGWYTEKELQDEVFDLLSDAKKKEIKTADRVVIERIYPLLVLAGDQIYCKNNIENRPYRPSAADDYKLEILRKKWKFNGETIIVDKYGKLHDGQHRLIGLLLAIQEWKEDAKRPKDEQKWQKLWPNEPYIESLVVLGIESDDETTNTIGCGVRRSLEDVLFRSPYFEDMPFIERKRLSKTTAWASKVLWSRTDQKNLSSAPNRPHSESVDFIQRHERLLECVRFIYDEAGDKFNHMLPLGYAAGLMYLMATAGSDFEEYRMVNAESALNFDLWDKAEEFWVDVATNGKKTEPLRDALLNIPEDAGGSFSRDLRCGLVIKAWNSYVDDEKITKANVSVELGVNGIGQRILAETPRIGGIDVDYLPPQKEEKVKPESKKKISEKEANKAAVVGACPQGGAHDFIKDDGEEFCCKCYEPKKIK